jgi:hypothetical protein
VFKRVTVVASERERPAANGRLSIGVLARSKNRKSSEASAQVYRWRRDYGGPKLDQAKRLKDFERENVRLKTAVSELTLDKRILRKPLRENTKPKRACVNTCALETSERRACAVLRQPR